MCDFGKQFELLRATLDCCSTLKGSSFLQCILHSCPTEYGGGFGRASTAPMSFQAHDVMIAVAFESFVLTDPVDDPFAHGGPFVTLRRFRYVLTVTVTDAILRQQVVAVWIRCLAEHGGIAGIPVEHESWRRHPAEDLGGLSSSRG